MTDRFFRSVPLLLPASEAEMWSRVAKVLDGMEVTAIDVERGVITMTPRKKKKRG